MSMTECDMVKDSRMIVKTSFNFSMYVTIKMHLEHAVFVKMGLI